LIYIAVIGSAVFAFPLVRLLRIEAGARANLGAITKVAAVSISSTSTDRSGEHYVFFTVKYATVSISSTSTDRSGDTRWVRL
jgi:hypothetical protein